MYICLGIHLGHDRCAAVVKNGKVISAIAEERIDRIKYSKGDTLPIKSINYVLNQSEILPNQINLVAITHSGVPINKNIETIWEREMQELLKSNCITVKFIEHHLAHAYSSYFTSPYNNAAVMVADGGGDVLKEGNLEAESYYIADGCDFYTIHKRFQDTTVKYGTPLAVQRYDYLGDDNKDKQISLGFKYQQMTDIIGFGFGGAGKTMGLAPFGHEFISLELKINGFEIDLKYKDYIDKLFEQFLESGLSYSTFIEQNKENLAYDIQQYTSKALLALCKHLHDVTRNDNLCLSGGIFLNCVANSNILKNSGFKNVYIVPPSGDDGQAIGAALYGCYNVLGYNNKHSEIFMPLLGIQYTDEEIKQVLCKYALTPVVVSDEDMLIDTVVEKIHNGQVGALFKGRSEVGPRALGNRSLIASPSIKGTKDRINRNVKMREDFRPFAPIVTYEDMPKYFEFSDKSPYMLYVAEVRHEWREKLTEITHIDGSARLQTITKENDAFLWKLLKQMGKISGMEVLINTSFNTAGYPIVESPADAVKCFLSTAIDFMILEGYLVSK